MQKQEQFFREEPFQSLEFHFARHMLRLEGTDNPGLFLASGLLCYEVSKGNVCIDLSRYAGKASSGDFPDNPTVIDFPALREWEILLQQCHCVGTPGQKTPLMLESDTNGNRLYLSRYWQYETTLAQFIGNRLKDKEPQNKDSLQAGLDRLFGNPQNGKGQTNDQRMAAASALQHQFCVITGGPGTGKTTIVVKLLALLLENQLERRGTPDLRYSLVAPTGKAASRLKQSAMDRKEELKEQQLISPAVYEKIQAETSTIHRLLGTIPGSVFFRHHRENPLPIDCLVVDEASMVDLALMSKLVEALPEHARIILLGDKDQLASVEAGSVLGDICNSLETHPVHHDAVVKLRQSHRFDSSKGIGKLSQIINEGRGQDALRFLEEEQSLRTEEALSSGIVAWKRIPVPKELATYLKSNCLPHFQALIEEIAIEQAFERFERFMLLCALRKGIYGANSINRLMESLLAQSGVIRSKTEWYAGKPILITANSYQLDLYNGDIGIVFADGETGELKVYFREDNGFRKISPYRLPTYEPAYAMTVHKSQGSEFDEILLVLPSEENRLVTRELIYTGITRARKKAVILGNEQIFPQSIKNRIERFSGLQLKLDRLQEASE